MSGEPALDVRLPYVVGEVEPEVSPTTGAPLRRWVIVAATGNVVSVPAPFLRSARFCALLMWWLTHTNTRRRAPPTAE